jgi:hypothetical protein
MALKFQVMFFWVVTPWRDVLGYRRFGGPCLLVLRNVGIHITTRRYNPEDHGLEEEFLDQISNYQLFRKALHGGLLDRGKKLYRLLGTVLLCTPSPQIFMYT